MKTLALATFLLTATGLLSASVVTYTTNASTIDNAYTSVSVIGPSSDVPGAYAVTGGTDPYIIGFITSGVVPTDGPVIYGSITADITNGVAIQIWNPANGEGAWVVQSGLGSGLHTFTIDPSTLTSLSLGEGSTIWTVGFGPETGPVALSTTLVSTPDCPSTPEPGTLFLGASAGLLFIGRIKYRTILAKFRK